jgi:hypothetical protein
MIVEISFWNSMATLVFGACFNLLTLWMIARHTPAEMHPYSALLRQTCVSDLILLAASYFVQPVGILLKFYFIFFFDHELIKR